MARLKAYVLMESMIAMVLILLCFGIAIMIYNNVVSGNRAKLRVLARLRMENLAMNAKAEDKWLDQVISFDEFRVEQKVLPFRNTADVYELQFIATMPDGKNIGEYHELIRRP